MNQSDPRPLGPQPLVLTSAIKSLIPLSGTHGVHREKQKNSVISHLIFLDVSIETI
jgi:hypothetical protein